MTIEQKSPLILDLFEERQKALNDAVERIVPVGS